MLTYEANQVLRMCDGLTYRQLDHWTTRGFIKADEQHPGNGYERRWLYAETVIIRIGLGLIKVGFKPESALTLARRLRTEENPVTMKIADGLDIRIGVLNDV
jgi:hypothetical protein